MTVVDKIRALYKQNPDAKEDFKGKYRQNYTNTLDHYLKEIEKNPPKVISLESLDNIEDHDVQSPLCLVLAHLPPKVLCEEFGENVLFWTWVSYPYSTQKDKLGKAVTEITGKDGEQIEKARLASWRLLEYNKSGSIVLAISNVIDYINSPKLDKFDLRKNLQDYAKDGIELSQKRLGDYSLAALNTGEKHHIGHEINWGRNIDKFNDGKTFSVYLDTPVAVGLMYKGMPNAILGIIPTDSKTLMVYQMQGVQRERIDWEQRKVVETYSSRGLAPLKWSSLMLKVAEDIARDMDFNELAIKSGHNNSWTKPYNTNFGGGDGEIHLPLERALVIYDGLANTHGFDQRDDKNWYKKVERDLADVIQFKNQNSLGKIAN